MAEVTSGERLTVIVLDDAETAALRDVLAELDDAPPALDSLRDALGVE